MARSRKGGVLLPTAPNVVALPVVAYDLKNLDDRQYRGYEMYRNLLGRGKGAPIYRDIDDASGVYVSTDDRDSAYIVKRKVSNERGTMKVEYSCGCPDFLKNLRSGCKHTFCKNCAEEKPRRPAARRSVSPVLTRSGAHRSNAWVGNGKSERSNQRDSRVFMPTRIPELIDSLRAFEDRMLAEEDDRNGLTRLKMRGRQKTTDSTRAATLLLKVSNGVSADAMVSRYDTYIKNGVLPLRHPPHQNTLTNWTNDADLEPVLQRMFRQTVLLFRAMETVGIMDSTKLSNAETIRSRGVEYQGDVRPLARWLKCHVISGLESSAILAYEFSASNVDDIKYYKTLVNAACRRRDNVNPLPPR